MRSLLVSLLIAGPLMAEVKLENISFDQLEKAVAAHKGKVVVIDVWGTF